MAGYSAGVGSGVSGPPGAAYGRNASHPAPYHVIPSPAGSAVPMQRQGSAGAYGQMPPTAHSGGGEGGDGRQKETDFATSLWCVLVCVSVCFIVTGRPHGALFRGT